MILGNQLRLLIQYEKAACAQGAKYCERPRTYEGQPDSVPTRRPRQNRKCTRASANDENHFTPHKYADWGLPWPPRATAQSVSNCPRPRVHGSHDSAGSSTGTLHDFLPQCREFLALENVGCRWLAAPRGGTNAVPHTHISQCDLRSFFRRPDVNS